MKWEAKRRAGSRTAVFRASDDAAMVTCIDFTNLNKNESPINVINTDNEKSVKVAKSQERSFCVNSHCMRKRIACTDHSLVLGSLFLPIDFRILLTLLLECDHTTRFPGPETPCLQSLSRLRSQWKEWGRLRYLLTLFSLFLTCVIVIFPSFLVNSTVKTSVI